MLEKCRPDLNTEVQSDVDDVIFIVGGDIVEELHTSNVDITLKVVYHRLGVKVTLQNGAQRPRAATRQPSYVSCLPRNGCSLLVSLTLLLPFPQYNFMLL